jgi:hypothetical protein
MNIVKLLFTLLYIDRFYISLVYLKSKLYSQNPKQEIAKLRYNSERVLYYIFLSCLSVNISIIFWTNTIYIYLLTLPQISSLIIEHPLFQYYYLQVYEYFIIILIDISCYFIAIFLNFVGKILFSESKNIVSFKEIRMIVDKLDRYILINIFRIIVFGFIYEYIFYYFRFIGIGNMNLNKETKRIFVNELIMAFKQKNWNYVLSPTNINKIFIIIRDSEKNIKKIQEKIYLIYIAIFSYSTILYLSPFLYIVIIGLIQYIEKRHNNIQYIIILFIVSLYSIEISIVCLLFLSPPKISFSYKFKIIDLYFLVSLFFVCSVVSYFLYQDIYHFISLYLLSIFYYVCYRYTRLNINDIIMIDYFVNEEDKCDWINFSPTISENYIEYTSIKDNDFVHIISNTDINHFEYT